MVICLPYTSYRHSHETTLASNKPYKMALVPPQPMSPPNFPGSSTGASQHESQTDTQAPSRPALHLELNPTSPPIPSFLEAILLAHPSLPTPIPTTPNANASSALYTLPQAPPPPEDPLIPPENFSIVASGVYRSGFPKKRNFKFMEGLRLKTVLTLVLEDYPDGNLKWCEERDVQFMVCLVRSDV